MKPRTVAALAGKPTWGPDDKGRDTKWLGGYIRYTADGTATFYICRSVDGADYEVSTRAHNIVSAMEHLKRFEGSPSTYRASGETDTRPPIYLDDVLFQEFLAWSARPQSEGGQGNTKPWVRKQKSLLLWWMGRLTDSRDKLLNLRKLSLDRHILRHLDGDPVAGIPPAKGRANKIRVIKVLYSYLREVKHRIEPHEDPTFGKLKTPQSRAAQRKGKVKVTTRENIEKVLTYLEVEVPKKWAAEKTRGQHGGSAHLTHRDALLVQAGTGWHTTEVVRFAEGGECEQIPENVTREHGVVGILVCPRHKDGGEHRTKVQARVFEAGERLRAHGSFSQNWYERAVKGACKALGIPPFTPANMRHTNSTFAVNQGVSPKTVSEFHKHSEATSRKFYATHAVAAKVPTILDEGLDKSPVSEIEKLKAQVAQLQEQLATGNTATVDADDETLQIAAALLAKVRAKKG